MAFSTKTSAVMLLLLAIFSVLSLGAALPVTTDLAIRDSFDQTASTHITNLKRAVPAGSTLQCDSVTAPISKAAVRSNFVEKYCGRIDGEVFRKSGIEEVCTEVITTMYMFVKTINGDWASQNHLHCRRLCQKLIICRSTSTRRPAASAPSTSSSTAAAMTRLSRGGTLIIDDHVRYILKVFKFGGMTGKEPKCLT